MDIESCLSFITTRSAKVFEHKLEELLRPYGITRPQCFALFFLSQAEQMTQRELADKMGVKEPTIGRLILNMERDALVIRESSMEDRRANYLRLSPHGYETCQKLAPIVEGYREKVLAGLDDTLVMNMIQGLNKMMENISKL